MSRAALSLGLTQASKVTGQIGEEFGIRQLTLEAEGSGDQTSVVASGYLTDELSVRYGVGIFEPITTVALRYDLGRYFTWRRPVVWRPPWIFSTRGISELSRVRRSRSPKRGFPAPPRLRLYPTWIWPRPSSSEPGGARH